jgi:hypothetical protein
MHDRRRYGLAPQSYRPREASRPMNASHLTPLARIWGRPDGSESPIKARFVEDSPPATHRSAAPKQCDFCRSESTVLTKADAMTF